MVHTNNSSIFDVIKDISKKADLLIKNPRLDLPLEESEFCIICKISRIDSDITGVTCGNPKCLQEVGDMAFNQAESEKDIKEREEDLKENEDRLDKAIEVLNGIYLVLGINQKEIDTDEVGKKCEHLAGMCEAVESKVKDLVEVMLQLNKKIENKAN